MNYLWNEPEYCDDTRAIIEIGDTVRLGAGGPEMTVTDLNEHNVIASISTISSCALPRACVTLVRKGGK